MFKRTQISVAVLLATSSVLPVLAQETPMRVEITGSSVRRIDAEAALPVQILTKEAIAKSGATSTVDLLRKLPTVQGSTGEASAVGGATFGFAGVSVHNVGETRTLVLLNGHRLTLFGGQTLTGFAAAMDLNAIPVSAIERVEILTDGASALYGADAIAGVVNFITKRDTTEGDISIGISHPEAGGAQETRISATKGFGSLAEDGFNAMVTVSHDSRTKLNSTQRDFSKSGRIFFGQNGKRYRFLQYSVSPIPANALNDRGELISPYLQVNGSCPEKTFRVTDTYEDGGESFTDDYCGFDYVGELEVYPERKRDSLMVSFDKALSSQHTLFADLLYSKTNQISRIAPVPGSISIPAGSALHDEYLLPLGITGDSLAFYRIYDLGKRTSDDTAKFLDLSVGVQGLLGGWDYKGTFSHSKSDAKSDISGYPGALAVARLRASGALDPFVLAGQQSEAGLAALAAANYKGYWDGGTATLDTLSLQGSTELATLPAGPLQLGVGTNFNKEKFESNPSLFAQGLLSDPVAGTLCDPVGDPSSCDQRFGDASASPPYSADRKSWGLFGELVIPAMKGLEFTGSARYDHYSDFGNATTVKGAFRWSPTASFLVRGSIGTGFHAPTVPQVKASRRSYGVTSDNYTCSADLQTVADSLGAECQPGNRQYDQIAGGNADLKPEKSRQATLGIRFEPSSAISLGADLWHVQIRDSFGQLTEQEVFGNPLAYPNSWGTAVDIGTGTTYLAFVADNQNLGKSFQTGLDFDISGRTKTPVGDIQSSVTATYMIREAIQLQKDGKYFSAIGDNGELGTVTFRWQGQWKTTLTQGAWAHTLGVNFKSGYRDQEATVDVLDGDGNVIGSEDIRLNVPSYVTLDWQTQYNLNKNLVFTLGVLNLADEDPPLSLSTGGVNKGQQIGYDDRYYDPRGRTWYLNASYKF